MLTCAQSLQKVEMAAWLYISPFSLWFSQVGVRCKSAATHAMKLAVQTLPAAQHAQQIVACKTHTVMRVVDKS